MPRPPAGRDGDAPGCLIHRRERTFANVVHAPCVHAARVGVVSAAKLADQGGGAAVSGGVVAGSHVVSVAPKFYHHLMFILAEVERIVKYFYQIAPYQFANKKPPPVGRGRDTIITN